MKTSTLSRYLFVVLILISCPRLLFAQEEGPVDSTMINLIYDYGQKGYDYLYFSINLDSAEYFLRKAIDLAYTSSDYAIDERVAFNYNNLGSLYRNIFNYNEALDCYNKAEEILKNDDPTHETIASIIHNKGNIYKDKGDFFRTKEYYEYALDFLVKNQLKYTYEFEFIYSNYIKLLLEMELDELAEEKLDMVDISGYRKDPFIVHKMHITYATAYAQLGYYSKALYHFNEAQRIVLESPHTLEITIEMIVFYYAYIDFYILFNRYQEALDVCDQAYIYIESLDPQATKSKTIYQTDIQYRTASIYFRLGKWDEALSLVEIGIDNLKEFLLKLSFGDPELAEKKEFTTTLPDLYVLRSQILMKMHKATDDFDQLRSAYNSYIKAINTLNFIKLAMGEENSKLFATSQVLEIYYEAIEAARLMYEETGEIEYLEQSFEFAETSKSFALYSEIKEIEAMHFADIPDEIRNRENRLVGAIQYTENLLYGQQMLEEPDSGQIEYLKETLFHLKADYEDLINDLEQNNEKYYELKYNPPFVSLEDIQDQLPYKDALIEYVLSDTLLITYVVDRKGINMFSQTVDRDFAAECLDYYQLMMNQNFSSNVHETYKNFVNLGRKFYKILIEPCLEYTDRKNLTIVPDGAISYIPFESLMTEDTETEYINYLILPYMIREYSIGYSHSSTLMFSKRHQNKSPQHKVLAFAPMYGNSIGQVGSERMRQGNEYLVPLLGTIKEVQSIDETVPSDVFINEQATEANFKKNASDYEVLHLAMHTIMRDDDPLYSELIFSDVEEGDTIEDNRLYAYEIYNLKLNASMAVLSSCNSGYGKMQKGEGMMSLARGFIYAGCPSIVMTLWQVADKSSSDLMTSFYKYLKKGKSKQEAMRLAKTDYLEQSDNLTSNPYFWSGFVVLGDSSPIYKKSGFVYWIIVVAVFIGGMVFIQYRRSRARKNSA